MLKINEYFNGKVKSIGLTNEDGKSTVGVMEEGEYEFNTSSVEHMTVVSGSLKVMQPQAVEWQSYSNGQTFTVAANVRFKVRVEEQTAYICFYE